MTELIFKAAAIALVASAAALLLKDRNRELAYLLAVVTAAVLCMTGLSLLGSIKAVLTDIAASSGVSSAVFVPLLKCVGIALTVKIAASLCKDAGQSAAAAATEYIGAAAAVITALPLLESILATLKELT